MSTVVSSKFLEQNNIDAIPLAHYKMRIDYIPKYGDYVIWSKWFSTWHGLVKHYNKETDELQIIFAGVPFLLFTMPDVKQEAETYKIKLSEIKNARNGKYAIKQQNDQTHTGIWYI